MVNLPEEPPLRFFCISLYYYDGPSPSCRIQSWTYHDEEKFHKSFERLVKRHNKLVKPFKPRLIGDEAIDGKWIEIRHWEKL